MNESSKLYYVIKKKCKIEYEFWKQFLQARIDFFTDPFLLTTASWHNLFRKFLNGLSNNPKVKIVFSHLKGAKRNWPPR